MIYTDIVEYNIVGDTKAPFLRCFPLHMQAQIWRHNNYWTIQELSEI